MSENPLVLSASSVGTYLRCGLQWYYGYVAGIKSPPSLRQAIGIAGHKAVETNMSQKIDSRIDLPESDVLDAFSSEFDSMSPDIVVDEAKGEDLGGGKDSGVKAVAAYHRIVAPAVQPIEVEKSFQFEINGVPYSGQMDVIDDDAAIRDTKFVGQTPAPDKYELNMTGYAIGYRQGASEAGSPAIESDTILDVIVRTKEPKYVPVRAGGPVTDEQVRRFAFVVAQVEEGIRKGNFPPNGLAARGVCDWCGYKDICPAKQGSMKRAA